MAATVSGTAGRDYLSGVFRAANARPKWSLEVFDTPENLLTRLKRGDRPDGLILMFPSTKPLAGQLAQLNIPTVIVDFPPAHSGDFRRTSYVRLDDDAIGQAAANHLTGRGQFNSFLCILDQPQFTYAHVREQAFREALATQGAFIKTVSLREHGANRRDLRALGLTLARLPRPIGVFAVRDRAARCIYDACREQCLSIPDEVAVLGVDNDELFCNTVSVPLSSILPDHKTIGEMTVQEMDRLLSGRRGREVVLRKSVREIVLRASTRTIPPAARIVSEAQAFIERHVDDDLRVTDVVSHLGISRRLADLRFRQVLGTSIHKTIVSARLNAIRRRLGQSNEPIAKIAAEFHFSSVAVFSRFFRDQIGQSPSAWRKHR